ncbi:hypothetical protein [Desertivirga arenae]|uniref:hypothetical protein n=1 Tax=Desertivirga arenae TaxID=2810309 RepID=UPI001A97BD09|nr:hypothetical protein [Pedobacter sp. SYSU D00823]
MDEIRAGILDESNKYLTKLQLHSAFFSDEIIYKIYLRSQVIHQLFESNPELDINKLELFHLQYTATVIELLKKIKKTNERNVSLLYDEIQLNDDLINKLDHSVLTESSFNLEKQRQAVKMNTSLRRLYQFLSEDSTEYPFSRNINSFNARYSQDFFFDISPEAMFRATEYQQNEVYTNAYATIQRKLMGLLCKYDFRTEFYYGLKAGDSVLEVYKFLDQERYFFYYPNRTLFLLFDITMLADIDLTSGLSKRSRIIHELKDKNDKLESRANVLKSSIPADIKNLLTEHYKKISDIDFLQNIANFDVQANILKTMLNTDSI